MSRYKLKHIDKKVKLHSISSAWYLAAAITALANKQMDSFVLAYKMVLEELESAKFWDEIRKNPRSVK